MQLMANRATLRDVAEAAGVSVSTVSAVLNGGSGNILFSEETAKRIHQQVDRLGYQVNQNGRRLRRGKSDTIGVVLDDLSIPFMAEMIHAMGRSLDERGLSLVLFDLPDMQRARDRLETLFKNSRVDGVILGGSAQSIPFKDIRSLDDLGFPIVTVEHCVPDSDIPSVELDNYLGGKLAVERLLREPADRLLVLSGPAGIPTVQARLAGAMDAWQSAGKNTKYVKCIGSSWHARDGYETMQSELQKESPNIVFAMNDQLAAGALRALHESNTSARVVGFDDTPTSEFCSPPLTTLRQPVQKMASVAIEMLISRIDKKTIHHSHQMLSPTLIVRQSG